MLMCAITNQPREVGNAGIQFLPPNASASVLQRSSTMPLCLPGQHYFAPGMEDIQFGGERPVRKGTVRKGAQLGGEQWGQYQNDRKQWGQWGQWEQWEQPQEEMVTGAGVGDTNKETGLGEKTLAEITAEIDDAMDSKKQPVRKRPAAKSQNSDHSGDDSDSEESTGPPAKKIKKVEKKDKKVEKSEIKHDKERRRFVVKLAGVVEEFLLDF